MTTVETLNGLSRLLLAYVFLSSGGLKVFLDTPALVKEWGTSVAEQPAFGVRVLGMVEILAGIVLVVPLLLNVPQVMATAGAVIVVMVMAGALVDNIRANKIRSGLLNLALALVAGFVIWTQSSR